MPLSPHSSAIFIGIILMTSLANVGLMASQAGDINVEAGRITEYSIALPLPPDFPRLLPDLALTYNDSSGNGIAGYRWHLRGIPRISKWVKAADSKSLSSGNNFTADSSLWQTRQRYDSRWRSQESLPLYKIHLGLHSTPCRLSKLSSKRVYIHVLVSGPPQKKLHYVHFSYLSMSISKDSCGIIIVCILDTFYINMFDVFWSMEAYM
jgi:hypothetical protein